MTTDTQPIRCDGLWLSKADADAYMARFNAINATIPKLGTAEEIEDARTMSSVKKFALRREYERKALPPPANPFDRKPEPTIIERLERIEALLGIKP